MQKIESILLNSSMDKVQFIKENYGVLSNLEISKQLAINPKQVSHIARKNISYNLRYRRGKSPHCKPKRKFNLNDEAFSNFTINSCYWAGLLAADGNVNSKYDSISLSLKESDKLHIIKFKDWLKFDGPVRKTKTKYIYKGEKCYKFSYGITITSKQIKENLNSNFNITSKKSLTLLPPPIYNPEHVDSFIKGYIDGDGSIGTDRDNTSRFSLMGTFEMMSWIKKRFETIAGRLLPDPHKKNNMWIIEFKNKISRKLLRHLFEIPTPELNRKWTPTIKNIVFNYKKSRDELHYRNILNMRRSGMNQTEVAKMLNITSSAVSWIEKQELYKNIIKETAERDKGEENMEEEN